MKIYFGKNKKEAKEITLKRLMIKLLKADHKAGRFGDDSGSWLPLKKKHDKGEVEVELDFDITTDNIIVDFSVWNTPYKLDEDRSIKII